VKILNDSMMNLQFLKLGGSLITDKNTPRKARQDAIARLVHEIKIARREIRDLRLVLGHGSGSFGHVPAKKYGTRQGVDAAAGWRGFAEVWYEAALLNRIVMDTLHEAGLPAVAFPPSAGILAHDGQVARWEIGGLQAALEADLIPVVFGDVIFDQVRGGTIFSTEDLFTYLARQFLAHQLHPQRILLAGIDEGVWADFPACTQLISEITPANWDAVATALGGSAATDVTGGMRSKVQSMLDLAIEIPGLEISIFSGDQPGNLAAALQGQSLGTRIFNNHGNR
jgi:isopentenyl phosphate kinase